MGNIFVRIAAVSLSVGLMVGLSGCGGRSDPAPSTSPPTTPAPVPETISPSASPTPTGDPTVETVRPEIDIPEPEMYPEMANDDIQGADTAARYFLDLYGYAYETGDLTAWNKFSDADCVICENVRGRVADAYEKGHWFEDFALLHGPGGVYYPTEDVPYYIVVLEVTGTARIEYDAQGELVDQGTETFFPEYAVGVQYRAPNEWIIIDADPRENTK